jgi:uncharacterized membrane protein YoaK (UPF0700 family)
MDIVLAKVWTFWIAVALVIPAIMLAVGIVIGYLYKVVMPRYPKR